MDYFFFLLQGWSECCGEHQTPPPPDRSVGWEKTDNYCITSCLSFGFFSQKEKLCVKLKTKLEVPEINCYE